MSKNHKNRDNTVSVKETEVLEEVINHEVHVNNNIIEEKLSLTEEAKAEPEIKKEIKITEEVPIITEEELVPVIDDITISEEDSNEGDVFYIQINKEPFTDERLSVVMQRLDKYSLERKVTANGIVLVGPYLTKEGAVNGRRYVIRSGLKGDIVK
jgi:hypothetical protein